jgi:hypothetical protein
MRKIAKFAATAVLLLSFPVFANSESLTDIDLLLAGMEYKFPPLDSSYRGKQNNVQSVKGSDKIDETWTLQFDATSNIDVAMSRRAQLQAQTGFEIQINSSEPPYHKLRGGTFKSKADAEDKARELSLSNIHALPVKVK